MANLFDMVTDPNFLIIALSSLGAMISVLLVGAPMLKKQENKQVIKRVLDYRSNLYAAEKQRLEDGKNGGGVRQMLPDMNKIAERMKGKGGGSRSLRMKLSAAGLRKPKHMASYLIARLVLPFVCAGPILLFLHSIEDPPPQPIILLIAGFCAALGFLLPDLYVKNLITRRDMELREFFPDALDLMLVCVEGGLGIEQAMNIITREYAKTSPILAEEFGILSAEMAYLGDRTEALKNFSRRVTNASARSFSTAVIQSEKYGTPLASALRTQASELRHQRMSDAEKKAAALPPKLTVPMIAFFMPSLFIVILGPAVITAFEQAAQT